MFYLLMAVFGVGASLARRGLIVAGQAATTATNIQAHRSMYLLAYASDLLMVACYVVVVALLYRVFEPVRKSVALIGALVGFMGCAILAMAVSYELAPVALLGTAPYLSSLPLEQRQALAYFALRCYSDAYGVSLVFFGGYLFLTGWLVIQSRFLPRVIGWLLMLGIWGMTFLAPPLAAKYLAWIRLGSVGELALTIWLIWKGVDGAKWLEQALQARTAEVVDFGSS